MKKQQGFTLVEIALVLVVIGLILGGLLKGQALIDNARARSMATQIDNVSAAWYGFVDRYRALPGDFQAADTRISTDMNSGDGDGRINTPEEVAQVWQHLSAAGFVAGNFDGDSSGVGLDDAT
ncbi:MAG: prepilin-type N-terminal cleavage/methylation domain-containing protein, partial [Granulosicoccaceae bacterium]